MPRLSILLLSLVVSAAAWALDRPSAACASSSERPRAAALAAGLAAYGRHRRRIRKKALWTLIDYDQPFTAVRLWVLAAGQEHRVLMASRVSHAGKSGGSTPRSFPTGRAAISLRSVPT